MFCLQWKKGQRLDQSKELVTAVAYVVSFVQGLAYDEPRVIPVLQTLVGRGSLAVFGVALEVATLGADEKCTYFHDVESVRQHFSDVLVELLPRIEAAFACVDTRGPQHVCFYQFYQAIVNMLVVFRELKRAAGVLSSDLQRIQAKCLHAIGCVAGDMADMVSRH